MAKRYSLCTFKDKHDVTQAFMREDEEGNYVKVADYDKVKVALVTILEQGPDCNSDVGCEDCADDMKKSCVYMAAERVL